MILYFVKIASINIIVIIKVIPKLIHYHQNLKKKIFNYTNIMTTTTETFAF